jgi:hypothetical protein
MSVEVYSDRKGWWSWREDDVESGSWFRSRDAALNAVRDKQNVTVVHERSAEVILDTQGKG